MQGRDRFELRVSGFGLFKFNQAVRIENNPKRATNNQIHYKADLSLNISIINRVTSH